MVQSDYNKFTEEKLCYNLSKSLNIWARNLGNHSRITYGQKDSRK